MASSLGAWRWTTAETTGRSPSPRGGYASGIVNKTVLCIAGGWNGRDAFGDAYTIDMNELKWRVLALRSEDGSKLDGRIFFAHAVLNHNMFIHGGSEITNLNNMHDDVLVLDMMASTLRTLETVGESPGYVSRHAMATRAQDQSLWIVGGHRGFDTAKGGFTQTTYKLDLAPLARGEPARWHKIEAEGFSPWARAFACLVSMPRPSPYLYLFGGGDGNIDFDDVYALNVGTSYWERITNVTGDKGPRSQAGCSLLPLRRRGGASASGHPSFALALHGGYGGPRGNVSQHARLSSARLLTLGHTGTEDGAWQWLDLRSSGALPKPRNNHNLVVVNSSLMVAFGGSIGNSEHADDLLLGTPNRLLRPDATEAELDLIEAEAAEAEAEADEEDDAWYMGGEEAAADNGGEAGEEATAAHPMAEEEDAEEMVVVRTVRTSDKLNKRKKKGKKRGGGGGGQQRGKDEL